MFQVQNYFISLQAASTSHNEDSISVKTILEPVALYECSPEVVPLPTVHPLRTESSAMEQDQIVELVYVKHVPSQPDNNYQPSPLTSTYHKTQLQPEQWRTSDTPSETMMAVILPRTNGKCTDPYTNLNKTAPTRSARSDYIAFSQTLCSENEEDRITSPPPRTNDTCTDPYTNLNLTAPTRSASSDYVAFSILCNENEEVKITSPLHKLQHKMQNCDHDGYITNTPFCSLLENQLELGEGDNEFPAVSIEGSIDQWESTEINSDIYEVSDIEEEKSLQENQVSCKSTRCTSNEVLSDLSQDEDPNLTQSKHHFPNHSHLDELNCELKCKVIKMQDDYIYV